LQQNNGCYFIDIYLSAAAIFIREVLKSLNRKIHREQGREARSKFKSG
jgi:hypothetical protein